MTEICRTEGRGQDSARGGALGGRGRGRGGLKSSAEDFLVNTQEVQSQSQSRKRNKISPEKTKSVKCQ